MIKIDKSVFTAEELAQYEALIAKATVNPEPEEEEEEVVPPNPKKKEGEETKKSVDPELQKAMEEVTALKKSFEMKEMTDIAKKYASLGKKEDELATTLYEMKKSNPANYEAYIAVLDEHLALVEKSGLFTEIGKSAGNYKAGTVESKIEAKANEIMKADPSINRTTAIAKAWQESPELAAEYEEGYYR